MHIRGNRLFYLILPDKVSELAALRCCYDITVPETSSESNGAIFRR